MFRKETGACVVFITRHFDGKKLKIPLTKVGYHVTFANFMRGQSQRL